MAGGAHEARSRRSRAARGHSSGPPAGSRNAPLSNPHAVLKQGSVGFEASFAAVSDTSEALVPRGPLHARLVPAELRALQSFSRWEEDELEHFTRVAVPMRFAAGEVLVSEGDSTVRLMVLAEGEAEVIRDSEVVRRLNAGQLAPELALLDGAPATATVIACSRVRILALIGPDFHNLLEIVPSLGRGLLIVFAHQLRSMVSEHC
jgi:CRP/FNR family cyclic AMP-dependent transcriptional regulator